jgi:hypothetical protein
MNQGNFLEMVDLLAYNEEVKVVVLSNALLCAGLPAPQLASCCAICLDEALFSSLNSPLNFTMQKEDSPSHQNIGKCMEY